MSVQLEALDILGDLLSRFGGKLISRALMLKRRCYGMEGTHLKYIYIYSYITVDIHVALLLVLNTC